MNHYKLLAIVYLILASVSLLIYTIFLAEGRFVLLAVIMSVFGFSLSSLVPVCMEAAAKTVFPIPEGVSSGSLMAAANFYAVILTAIMAGLQDQSTGSMVISNWIATASLIFSVIVMSFW
eukprot:TRINITY_DN5398_c0_g1_i1.p1 TRINITY_DN5398_c0_g1~~TRINITY_DN5398_c0_g1_i1.p1  ORF type:complete len:120 (-),score=17.71 TRINITY_DN5398_c0_g1_i1:149-508(-)